jgi:hypothetical protein
MLADNHEIEDINYAIAIDVPSAFDLWRCGGSRYAKGCDVLSPFRIYIRWLHGHISRRISVVFISTTAEDD